jgi:hypothetical protein
MKPIWRARNEAKVRRAAAFSLRTVVCVRVGARVGARVREKDGRGQGQGQGPDWAGRSSETFERHRLHTRGKRGSSRALHCTTLAVRLVWRNTQAKSAVRCYVAPIYVHGPGLIAGRLSSVTLRARVGDSMRATQWSLSGARETRQRSAVPRLYLAQRRENGQVRAVR